MYSWLRCIVFQSRSESDLLLCCIPSEFVSVRIHMTKPYWIHDFLPALFIPHQISEIHSRYVVDGQEIDLSTASFPTPTSLITAKLNTSSQATNSCMGT
jgi:hypothetical protein